jgi:hypothetical protein
MHVLHRDYGLRRCRYHGELGMGRWVGWGVVTRNLVRIAAVLAERQRAARAVSHQKQHCESFNIAARASCSDEGELGPYDRRQGWWRAGPSR